MEGYTAVAQFMGTHDEMAIVRRFKELNMRDILYMQAEILHLKEELREQEIAAEEKPEKDYSAKDWWSLAHAEDEEGRSRWSTVLKIRQKLEQYNNRIAQQVVLTNLKGPHSYDLAFFRDWLQRPKMGNFPLLGLDRNAWEAENMDDLLAIRPRKHNDPVSRLVINRFVPWFHTVFGSRFKKPIPESPLSEISHYHERPIIKSINILGTIIASLLPISAIVILYFVTNDFARLGVIVAFTAVFSLCLTLVTQAKRVEIFVATSAFAAVQVVFSHEASYFTR
ncbi:hypothetical protein B0O99DRAFT_675689 [Bisporella sp. PMI_857]|nr:hypothetical protein B0O99DRAFT_675689 [Bisporella sp. PMI_857]